MLTGGSLEKTVDTFSYNSWITKEASFRISEKLLVLVLELGGLASGQLISGAVVTPCYSFSGNRRMWSV